jgi:small subunit ribosomal protein S1
MYKGASKYLQRRAAQGVSSVEAARIERARQKKKALMPVPDSLKKAFNSKKHVHGRLLSQVNGGYKVIVNGYNTFCPSSEMYPRDISAQVLKQLKKTPHPYVVIDVSLTSVVVSRKLAVKVIAWETVKKASSLGTSLHGEVVNIQPYGLFVDLDGITGLAHISKTPSSCPEDLKRKYKVGQSVNVIVLEVIEADRRISLCVRDE